MAGNYPRTPIAKLPLEKTFRVEYQSEMDGSHYGGRFTVKRPNLHEQMRIVGRKSEILEGKYYDPENPGRGVPQFMDTMAEMMAFLEVCVIEAPEWWDGGNIHDPELLAAVFERAAAADPFRQIDPARDSQSRTDGRTGGSEPDESRHNDPVASMVDEEV